MIPESISYPRSRIVSISIFLSLVLHSLLFYVQMKLYQENKSFVSAPASEVSSVKPMMFMMQPPPLLKQKKQSQAPLPPVNMQQAPPMRMPLPPALAQAAPIEHLPAGRRRYRVGTGFDAPDTDHALALGEKTKNGRVGGRHVSEQKQPLSSVMPAATAPQVMLSHEGTSNGGRKSGASTKNDFAEQTSPIMGRAPIRVMGVDERVHDERKTSNDAAQEATSVHQTTAPASLSFLAPQHFQDMMRQNILAPDDEPIGGIGEPGVSGGVARQYGDPKYLHYNSKVYTAIQQSLDVEMSQLSYAAYAALLEGVKRPARVRFSLDRDGKPHDIHISLSSNNARYDALVLRIIAQASFPAIPRSFNMHTTYQDRGIILYNDGTPHEHIGVSSYLDGE